MSARQRKMFAKAAAMDSGDWGQGAAVVARRESSARLSARRNRAANRGKIRARKEVEVDLPLVCLHPH